MERTHAPVLPSRRSAPTEAARQESGGSGIGLQLHAAQRAERERVRAQHADGDPVKRRHLVAFFLNCTVLLFSPAHLENMSTFQKSNFETAASRYERTRLDQQVVELYHPEVEGSRLVSCLAAMWPFEVRTHDNRQSKPPRALVALFRRLLSMKTIFL